MAARRLLYEDHRDAAAREVGQRRSQGNASGRLLHVVGAECVQVPTFHEHAGVEVERRKLSHIDGTCGRDQNPIGRWDAGAHQTGAEKIPIAVANRERGIDCDRAVALKFRKPAQRAFALTHCQNYFGVRGRRARGKSFRIEGLGLDSMRRQLGQDRIEDRGVGLDLAGREFHFTINTNRTTLHRRTSTATRAAARSAASSTSITSASSTAPSLIWLSISIPKNRRSAES